MNQISTILKKKSMPPNNKHILPSYFVLVITVLNLITGQTNALFFKLPPSSTGMLIETNKL